jgi:hypothetical protein
VRLLTPEECLDPGYHRDRDWTVRDVVAYLGTWLAEAQVSNGSAPAPPRATTSTWTH